MSSRSELKNKFLEDTTKGVSLLGTCLRARVGCVISRNGRILSTGYNGSPPGEPHCTDVGCQVEDGHCIRCTHAEANAIAWAAQEGIALKGSILWVYGWHSGSCHSCTKLAKSAGIETIIKVI